MSARRWERRLTCPVCCPDVRLPMDFVGFDDEGRDVHKCYNCGTLKSVRPRQHKRDDDGLTSRQRRTIDNVLAAFSRVEETVSELEILPVSPGRNDTSVQVNGIASPEGVSDPAWYQRDSFSFFVTAAGSIEIFVTDDTREDRRSMKYRVRNSWIPTWALKMDYHKRTKLEHMEEGLSELGLERLKKIRG